MMGIAELNEALRRVTLRATIVLYGTAASEELAGAVADDIAEHWNAPLGEVLIKNVSYQVVFDINGVHSPALRPEDVYENDDASINFFRIEEKLAGNISFVDGLNSNTGMFQLDNLLNKSTTAAHEFGHTLGLDHPDNLDIRGQGAPGIMFPRGTIVDPEYQYNPAAPPQTNGGTLNPAFRKVLQSDISDLKLPFLRYNKNGLAMLGDFSSIWHEMH